METNFEKLRKYIGNNKSLCFLDEAGEINDVFLQDDRILKFYIPLCPDYSFEINENNERIHDFNSMSDGRGIVYEKLIKISQPLFDFLKANNINYSATFLMADVEAVDPLILKKLGATKEEFYRLCNISAQKISADIKDRGINGVCMGMEKFFEEHNYDFHQKEDINFKRVKSGEAAKTFTDKVVELRKDLYNFWFGIDENECIDRAYKDIGMYAAFAEQKDISEGIILCADSEILSCAYNCLKVNSEMHTPVIYVKGTY